MTELLPPAIRVARESASSDEGRKLFGAFRALLAEDVDLAWLSLWKAAEAWNTPEPARTVAYALAKEQSWPRTTEAVFLWMLRAWRGKDLSTHINLLTALESQIADTESGLPATCRSSVPGFLLRGIVHSEASVRCSVLDFLSVAASTAALGTMLTARVAEELVRALRESLKSSLHEDEHDTLTHVCEVLEQVRSERVPENATELRALAAHLKSSELRLAPLVGPLNALVVLTETVATEELLTYTRSGTVQKAIDIAALAAKAQLKDRYAKQLIRVKKSGQQTDCIEKAVDGVMTNLPKAAEGALVVYGDPQSGKTEMMICLTARLLDSGYKVIVHLMNDSVDLLMQSLDRFKLSGLAPSPRNAADLANSPLILGHEAILFCKKNSKDLQKLITALKGSGPVVVIDDEADYATPNSKINQKEKTKINELVAKLLGGTGKYVGVTATPARLNLNNTFNNKPETWVHFPPHKAYTGPDTFFPLTGPVEYRRTELPGAGTTADAQAALVRFLVTVAHLNVEATAKGDPEGNYTFLVHTSGKTDDHKKDRKTIESAMKALVTGSGLKFNEIVTQIFEQAQSLYPVDQPNVLAEYVIANASRNAFVVLNSKRDRATAGDKPTEPTCPFTIIIGGNIVSRGVTFPNLLAMYFTRDVTGKLQQDTYIQRARMFGSRGKYLKHFELTIPKHLYGDWHRCFLFHRLALESIKNNNVSPVWLGDKRISIAQSSSIDRGTVDLNKGEMSFQMFDCPDPDALDAIVAKDPRSIDTLKQLAKAVEPGLPQFLIQYLEADLKSKPGRLAIHESSSIKGYGKSADKKTIAREKGFLGKNQLEEATFPKAVHHIKILYNEDMKARVFYKNTAGVEFVENQK